MTVIRLKVFSLLVKGDFVLAHAGIRRAPEHVLLHHYHFTIIKSPSLSTHPNVVVSRVLCTSRMLRRRAGPPSSAAIWVQSIGNRRGAFILYCIVIPKDYPSQPHCIGAATSPNMTGPKRTQSHRSFVPSPRNSVVTADPNGITYGSQRCLVFEHASGHDAQHTSYIAIKEIKVDGYTPTDTEKWTDLIASTAAEDNDVEGSVLVKNPSAKAFVLLFTPARPVQ